MKITGRRYINHTSKCKWLNINNQKFKIFQICLESIIKHSIRNACKAKRLRMVKNKTTTSGKENKKKAVFQS